MGRHSAKKYGYPQGYSGGRRGRGAATTGAYGMSPMMGPGGLTALVPLLGLGVVAAILFAVMKRKRALRMGGAVCLPAPIPAPAPVAANCAATCSTVGINEKLIAAERLPGVKYREVDVITRKRVSEISKNFR